MNCVHASKISATGSITVRKLPPEVSLPEKNYRVGLLIGQLYHELTSPFLALFIRGLCDILQQSGYTLSMLWCAQNEVDNQANSVRDFLLSDTADAYIANTELLNAQSVAMFKHTGRPIVALSNHPFSEIDNFHQINIDFSGAFAGIWEQLSPEIRSNVVFLGLGNVNKSHLIKKYAPADAKITYVDSGAIRADFINDRISGAKTAEKHWDVVSKAKLVWCSSDLAALGVCDTLKAHGLEPGKDIFVIGHDNLEATHDRYDSEPILSTVDPHWEKIGHIAAKFILEAVDSPPESPQFINCPATFINRKTLPYRQKQ